MIFHKVEGPRPVTGCRDKRVASFRGSQLLLKYTEVPLLLWDVPLSTFVSVGSALEAVELDVHTVSPTVMSYV